MCTIHTHEFRVNLRGRLGHPGAGMAGEDVEDQQTAIQDALPGQLLQVAHLCGGKVVVEDQQAVVDFDGLPMTVAVDDPGV